MGWLPLYHDMGLIAGMLQPVHAGIPAVPMSPRHFLCRPARCLETIARFHAAVSGGPDFAFRLCADRIDDGALAPYLRRMVRNAAIDYARRAFRERCHVISDAETDTIAAPCA